MPDSKITEGFVTITLDGEAVTLKPTLAAITAINAQFGGIRHARTAIAAEDFTAVTAIVQHGLGLTDAAAVKALPERVYRTGLGAELLVQLFTYVEILKNGGRPLPKVGDTNDGAGEGDSGNG